ncbi:MAG: hypothetical protein AAF267_04065 [Deinococcota bacterium]
MPAKLVFITRKTVLEQIQTKLQSADNNILNDVLYLLNTSYPLDDWDKKIIADSNAGKFDDLIKQLQQNHADGKYDVLTDGLKRN